MNERLLCFFTREPELDSLLLCDVLPAWHVHLQIKARLCPRRPSLCGRAGVAAFQSPGVSVEHLPLYSSHSIQCLKSRRLQSHSQGFCPSSRCWRLASGSNAALSSPRSLFPERDSHL